MKKLFLPLILLPTIILSSCQNDNGRGFVDPFGEQTYNGFALQEGEITSRPLTSEETQGVKNTKDKYQNFDYFINSCENITVKERDYLRAFSGEYEQGSNVSNKKKDINAKINKYNHDSVNIEVTVEGVSTTIKHKRRRVISEVTTNSTEQYSYGEIEKSETVTTYRHEENETPLKEGTYSPIRNIYERIKTKKGLVSVVTEDKIPVDTYTITDVSSEDGDDGESYYNISQKDYLLDTNIYSGADSNNNIIITEEVQEPYNKGAGKELEGYFILNNGKKYAALNKSLKVTKLSLVKQDSKKYPEWEDFYIVTYSRYYTETSITSKVIQPNTPVDYLKTPIPLKWKEEKRSFKFGLPGTDTSKLPEITKEEK